MDDLIKILMELMQKGPRKKGGILDTAEGVEFLGRQLTKSEKGDLTLIGSKLTDASRFIPFSIRNIGRDQRYLKINQYKNDLEKSFNKTIKFLQENPDIRLTAQQKDNLIYNLGVFRRVSSENTKLEKGIIDEGKTLEEVKKESLKNADVDDLTFGQAMSKILDQLNDVKDKSKKMKELAEESIFTKTISQEQKDRLKRLYYGRAYTGNESRYRGLGSFYLPKLHEAGIIKLDDTIYENLKKGAHHYGGATTFAPDPNRIWRKHFGDEVFDKLDNFRAEDGEDVFEWIKRNNIQPVTVKGPKSATDYLHPVEIKQLLEDELKVFNAYKNPKAESSRQYFNIDDPNMQLDRITFHGENIRFLEESLQRLDPDSYRDYIKVKPKAESPTVVPFKEDEGLEGITVLSGDDATNMLNKFLQKSDQLSGRNVINIGGLVDKTINDVKSLEPLEGIKLLNRVVKRDAEFKDLSDEQIQKIIDDTNEHIMGGDEPIDEFAKGGIVGLYI